MGNYNPLVSVIIPAFNVEKYIEETVSSVLNQTYTNFEIIVIDDSSTDKTPEIIENISKKNSRVKLFSIEHAGRPAVPRNFGISKAHGELIAFLDSDDLWAKEKLSAQIGILEKYPELIFVYSMRVTFGKVSLFSPHYEVLPLLHKAARSYDDLISKGNSITCSSVLIKKKYLEEVNGFDEDPELKAVEDYDLWLRLSKSGSFGFIPRIHTYYRVHSAQSSSDWEMKQKRLEYLASKRKIALRGYKFLRNKGILVRLLRNLYHYFTFLFVKILSVMSLAAQ